MTSRKHSARRGSRWGRRVLLCAGMLTIASALSGAAALADEAAPPFVVIVHPSNTSSTVSRDFLADAFLKKVTRWEGGEGIQPVDLHPSSRVRRVFSESVLKRSVAGVRRYWQQRIFSGRDLPPPELVSDQAVIDYVVRNRGGIGYVSGAARLGSAKALGIR